MTTRTRSIRIALAVCLAVSSCGRPPKGVPPADSSTAVAASPAPPSSAADDSSFCDTMKSKCPAVPEPAPDGRVLCRKLVSDPKCGAAALAAMRCDQRVETCDATGKPAPFTACHDEHAAADACLSAEGY